MTTASQLRRLLQSGEIVMAPGAPDAITARLVQKAGFPAVYMTGFGATASRLGTPDIGLLSQTEMTGHARDMVRGGETRYGDTAAAAAKMRRLVRTWRTLAARRSLPASVSRALAICWR